MFGVGVGWGFGFDVMCFVLVVCLGFRVSVFVDFVGCRCKLWLLVWTSWFRGTVVSAGFAGFGW